MKKLILMCSIFCLSFLQMKAQSNQFWTSHNDLNKIVKDKSVMRKTFPTKFDLYDLNLDLLRQTLFSKQNKSNNQKFLINLPNKNKQLEQFELVESSNFEPILQAKFPEIKAYSGKGITDKNARLKLSISPEGIQTMVFRENGEAEFIEPYSQNKKVYAVFKSDLNKGNLPWTCTTKDKDFLNTTTKKIGNNTAKSNTGQLKTMRLAQSCTGEYANYFGAKNASQVGLVLAAFNNTLTRCNGVFENDLGVHLNLIAASTNVIFYDKETDPYSIPSVGIKEVWNTELQNTLSSQLTGPNTTLEANNSAYDIGHLFGHDGGGGNAGCIGCVCEDDTSSNDDNHKGAAYTSPSDGIPVGDTFDIDFVAHEFGHQLGGSHTFSFENEGKGTNVEVGSGVTIMGYAGITKYDIAKHSIPVFHAISIQQIQENLSFKSCVTNTPISANNATPIAYAGLDYIIPASTPFLLTGLASDQNTTDALTYSWEQIDDSLPYQIDDVSVANPTKVKGPNWRSWLPQTSPIRYFPEINSIIANKPTTPATGNDINIDAEALSTVSRILNFRLTVRDNVPYSSVEPVKVGQTNYDDMQVTVVNTEEKFAVKSPNTSVSWVAGSTQTVTWNVAGTDKNNINTFFVDIFLSTDGGKTYPIQLAQKVPNDGSEDIILPNNVGTTNRIMVKGHGNIFFDISNANFSITSSLATFTMTGSGNQSVQLSCTEDTAVYTFDYKTLAGFSSNTSFTVTGLPALATTTFSPATINTNGTVTLTVGNLSKVEGGTYKFTIKGTSGAITKNISFYLYLGLGATVLKSPSNNAVDQSVDVTFMWEAEPNANSYDIQLASDEAFTNILTTINTKVNMYAFSNSLSEKTKYYWRVMSKNNDCTSKYSAIYNFKTGSLFCDTFTSKDKLTIPDTTFQGSSTINVPLNGIISDVNVKVNITHSYISDIILFLVSPKGTEIKLVSSMCDPGKNMDVTFDDSGAVLECSSSNPTINGTIKSKELLSTFKRENPAGDWTLKVIDTYEKDGGSLNSWAVNVCLTSDKNVTDNFNDLLIYPNPSNGTFTVKFKTTNEDVTIKVFDARGLNVYGDTFTNSTGFFNQELNLSMLQTGVYFMAIEKGGQRQVKRIIKQ